MGSGDSRDGSLVVVSRGSSDPGSPNDLEGGVGNENYDLQRGQDEEGTSIEKHLESGHTMFSFIWWIIGFYWVSAGSQVLTRDAPQLYWLCIVFLAFDAFFVIRREHLKRAFATCQSSNFKELDVLKNLSAASAYLHMMTEFNCVNFLVVITSIVLASTNGFTSMPPALSAKKHGGEKGSEGEEKEDGAKEEEEVEEEESKEEDGSNRRGRRRRREIYLREEEPARGFGFGQGQGRSRPGLGFASHAREARSDGSRGFGLAEASASWCARTAEIGGRGVVRTKL
ncbi:hypothetical protein IEQ34_004572 [Dendrobium chrysotoxum]|uniref:RING-type E3 ubiquitin transferase n=1 Tax=Dendrobium chrysotoxum TaxID=161865 RepID=A0AAV7HGX4_DENCH|nr:hypothetical protein IEQ34_004572 [Dendrobium chrysotoxum]